MIGVILAGGKGTRLHPMTVVTNKHLVPVGNLPMLEYPIYTLKSLNMNTICVVTGGDNFQDIAQYLGSMHPKINFSYHYQSEAGGIAQALSLVEQFVKDQKLAVILGDNIFEEEFDEAARIFEKSGEGAMVFLKEVSDPKRYGIAEIADNKIIHLEEKPSFPRSNHAVTGLYFYDSTVFDKIRSLKPSSRGELEITDVNNLYLQENKLGYYLIKGFWSDSGTREGRECCEEFVSKGHENKIFKMHNITL